LNLEFIGDKLVPIVVSYIKVALTQLRLSYSCIKLIYASTAITLLDIHTCGIYVSSSPVKNQAN